MRKITNTNIELKGNELYNYLGIPPTGINKIQIEKQIRKLQEDFVFLERDKNTYTWTITCKKWYLEKLDETFNDPSHYKITNLSTQEAMNEIELKSKNVETIVLKNRKNWKLGYAYIIPKDKDITRWRPIVSYWGFITDKIGHKMSRVLSVVNIDILQVVHLLLLF